MEKLSVEATWHCLSPQSKIAIYAAAKHEEALIAAKCIGLNLPESLTAQEIQAEIRYACRTVK